MVNENNKYVPKTPETYIVEELKERGEIKQSPLSAAARSKVISMYGSNYVSENQESYGPCSYSYCYHKGKSFDVDIDIEGCKWWARNPGEGTSLPGYWKQSPTGSYYWRENLYLNHVGHGQDADNLIGWNQLYTVNTVGAYATEDYKFCIGAQNFIRECVRIHEQGYGINEKKTLPSWTTSTTKWTIKIAAGAVATATMGPVGTALTGLGVGAAGEIIKSACDNDKAKHVWGMVSNTGEDMIKGAAFSSAFQAGGQLFGEAMTGSREVGRLLGNEVGKWEAWKDGVHNTFGATIHTAHLSKRSYDSDCPVCNP